MTITVGAVTYAIKARKLLTSVGIKARLVKVSLEANQGGCTHGIEIDEDDLYAAAGVLRSNGINYSVFSEQP